jgi:hypothetical protein
MKELAGLMITMNHGTLPAGFKVVSTLPVTEVNELINFQQWQKVGFSAIINTMH